MRSRHPEIVKLLLDCGLEPDDEELFALSAKHGRIGIVQLLLDRGVSPDCGGALEKALDMGHLNVVKLLLNLGASVNDKEALLLLAAEYGDAEIAQKMLHQGADPNEVEEEVEEVTGTIYYRTPLDWAEWGRHDECAAIIRKAGGVRSTELPTPLYTQY